jgi:hypothetical protein
MGALKRPKRTDKGEPGKRAARTCTKPTSGHNLAFLIRPSPERPARTSSHGRPQTTRPNDPPARTSSRNPPERVHTGALKRPARTSSQSRIRPARTSSHGRPQTTRPNEFTRAPSNDPPERVHTGALKRPRVKLRPARTSSHGRPQTTRPNDFAWAPERPKRSDKGEPGKRAARTCTKPTSGHNLAFLIRNDSSSPGSPQTTTSPERVHTGALKRPARTSLHGRPNDRNEPTRESRANELHERAQIQPRVTT